MNPEEDQSLELNLVEVQNYLQMSFDEHENFNWKNDEIYRSFISHSHEYIRYLKQYFWNSEQNIDIIISAINFQRSLLTMAFDKHFKD
jgi:hypothetical protein